MMKPFLITQEHTAKIETLLKDRNIELKDIRNKVNSNCFSEEDLSREMRGYILDSSASYPLLSMIDGTEEEALKYGQNVEIAKIFCDRLESEETTSTHLNVEDMTSTELRSIVNGA